MAGHTWFGAIRVSQIRNCTVPPLNQELSPSHHKTLGVRVCSPRAHSQQRYRRKPLRFPMREYGEAMLPGLLMVSMRLQRAGGRLRHGMR